MGRLTIQIVKPGVTDLPALHMCVCVCVLGTITIAAVKTP